MDIGHLPARGAPLADRLAASAPAVAAVFARRGYDATRMEDLVAATGVPRATLYYHFAGKDAVLAWLLRSTAEELREAVARAAAVPGTARDRLRSVVRGLFAFIAQRPDACRVLLANLEHAGRLPDIAGELAGAVHLPLADLIAVGAADGSLRPVEDPIPIATAVFGAVTITGLQYLVLTGEVPQEVATTTLCGLIFDGLGTVG
ncbi:MAG: TetR/AcrR family transcriptional regulator [Sporichthyaceae bacterium]